MFQPLSSIEALLAAAAREGLGLTAPTDGLDTVGLDFLVVHAVAADGVRWVVRSPRREDVVASARIEARVLALVRRSLTAAVPDWRVHADDVIAYPRLAGIPAVTVEAGAPTWNVIDPAAPSPVFLDSIAAVFAGLAAIPSSAARDAEIPMRSIEDERAWIAAALDTARPLLSPTDATWARWQRWLADDPSWPAHVALVHGDLHPGHMLLDDTGRITGVLDWTEARVTDPAVDLAMFHQCFGRAALEQVVTRYVALGAPAWPRMIEHAVERAAVFPALAAEWAARTGNTSALEYARAQLAAG